MGSGPFKFVNYDVGQSIKGERNPDYYHKGLPYLDGIVGIFAPKQATRVEAMRGDRAAVDFRGLPPSARDELQKELGDKITVQESDWNCGSDLFFNHKQKPFDDVRVRRALTLAIDRWGGAPALAKIAIVKTPGGIVFPGSPLAAKKEELEKMAGFWPDIEKSRAEAKRLLKEAGAENLQIELLNRDVDQPYKYVGIWLVDQWAKIGVKATQKVVPTGPWFGAMRSGQFQVVHYPICRSTVNPLLDVGAYLPGSDENYGYYDDPEEAALYDKLLHESDPAQAAGADDRVREAGAGYAGARHQGDLVEPDRAVPLLRQGLEDQPEPLPESGSVDGLARQVARHADQGPQPAGGQVPASGCGGMAARQPPSGSDTLAP